MDKISSGNLELSDKTTFIEELDRIDLDLLISECNYSQSFIKTANDLQILDAISECYEEYKLLSRGRTNRL